MAMRVLEGLPELIEAERRAVYVRGRWDAKVPWSPGYSPKPLRHRP